MYRWRNALEVELRQLMAPLLIAALWLVACGLRAARDAQSSADPRGSDRLSKRGAWWSYAQSWRNKYKAWPADTRPKFPGATTWAAGLTDFWHSAQSGTTVCIAAALLIAGQGVPWWQVLLALVPGSLAFEPMYRRLRR